MPELDNLISLISENHRRRCFAMEQRKRSDLALGAFIRHDYGFLAPKYDAENPERKRVNATAVAKATAVVEYAEHVVRLEVKRAELLTADGRAAAAIRTSVRALDKFFSENPEPEDWANWRDVACSAFRARFAFANVEDVTSAAIDTLVRRLPVWPWASQVRGLGTGSLGMIVAEAGDLSNYPTDGHLRSRMCVAVRDGFRQGRVPKEVVGEARKQAWKDHKYSPLRRARMWNVGEALVKSAGPYYDLYLERKRVERKHAEARGLQVRPQAEIPKKDADLYMSAGHVHNRAKRYVEQRLLRDLRRAWLACGEETIIEMSKDHFTNVSSPELEGLSVG